LEANGNTLSWIVMGAAVSALAVMALAVSLSTRSRRAVGEKRGPPWHKFPPEVTVDPGKVEMTSSTG